MLLVDKGWVKIQLKTGRLDSGWEGEKEKEKGSLPTQQGQTMLRKRTQAGGKEEPILTNEVRLSFPAMLFFHINRNQLILFF